MADSQYLNFIYAIGGLLIGFALNEIKTYFDTRKIRKEKQKKWAKILHSEARGVIDALNSYTKEGNKVDYGNVQMITYKARRISGDSVLSMSLQNIQNLEDYIDLFDENILELIFELKWTMSDLINTSNIISNITNPISEACRAQLEAVEQVNYLGEIGNLVELFTMDEKNVINTSFLLGKQIQKTFDLPDKFSEKTF